jgi:hypothetical protein
LAVNISSDGAITPIVVSPTGIFVPTKDGSSWCDLLDSLPARSDIVPTAITVAATGRILVGVIGGVILSDDHGDTWRPVPFRTPAPTITTIAASRDAMLVLAPTLKDGVFRSDDEGDRWSAWNFGLFDRGVLDLALSPAFERDRAALAITATGCFVSRNEGKSWCDAPLPVDGPELMAVCALSADPEWGAGTADGRILSVDAFGNVGVWLEMPAAGPIVALLPLGDSHIVAVMQSGAVATIRTENPDVQSCIFAPEDEAEITCACLAGDSSRPVAIIGWSTGRVTAIGLSSAEDGR